MNSSAVWQFRKSAIASVATRDAVDGVPAYASNDKEAVGEFSADNQEATWDCDDFKN